MGKLRLVRPSPHYRQAFMRMLAAYRLNGDAEAFSGIAKDPGFDFDAYIARLNQHARGEALPEGCVPYSTFWLTDDTGALYGTGRLRHTLTDDLLRQGGHIGYDIHPGYRKMGFGTEILRLLLGEAAKMGIPNALLTCYEDNAGSRRIIERNGGKFGGRSLGDNGKTILRFWVPTGGIKF